MTRRTLVTIGVLALAAAGAAATAGPPPDAPPVLRSPGDGVSSTAQLYGALALSSISVDFDRTPVREALRTVGARIGAPVLGRFLDEPLGHGLDPATEISLQVTGATGRAVLETILGQCEQKVGEPCTWQIRKGFIEAGTKRQLSVPAACEIRTYYVADLIMHIPEHPLDRKQREIEAVHLVGRIVETVEPGIWDYGQLENDDGDRPSDERPSLVSGRSGVGAPGSPDASPAPPTRRATAARTTRRYVAPQAIASIRYWRDVIIIRAPDHIHREIGGYPRPIPPDGT